MAEGKRTPRGRVTIAGVQDVSGFSFDLESPEANTAATRTDKPHYHEHRARLRAKFNDAGPKALADYELLEMVLFRVIARRDTKPLAKALLHRFGDIASLLAAPAERIAETPGAGPAVAQELKLLHALFVRGELQAVGKRDVISSWPALLSYCRRAMAHAPREQFHVLFLDNKNQLIADEIMGEGTIDQAPVYPREVARRALELSAASVILAHNHPSGDPTPSAADEAITQEVVRAAAAIGVRVHDHVVVARHGVVSLRALGKM